MYSAFARRLYASKSPQTASLEIDGLIGKLRDRTPSFDEFLIGFREIGFTNVNSKQKSLVRYILRNFSVHHAYKTPVDFDDLTIEHISPQSNIGKDSWNDRNIGQLGNLIFIDQKMNQLLDKKPFKEKKKLLESEGYDMSQFMRDSIQWTPAEVSEHTEQMAKVGYDEIWKV